MQLTSGFDFQVQGPNHTLEDRLLLDTREGVAAVADGVSRPRYDPGTGAQESVKVGTVAELFCSIAQAPLAVRPLARRQAAVAGMAGVVSLAAAEFNRSEGYDGPNVFVEADPYAAVGACAALGEDGCFHYGYLGDVFLAHFDGTGLRALSEDQVAPASRELAALAFADNEERRSYRRSKLRNQASARDSSGKPCGYGVFDGNPAACEFWSCGTLALGDGELIVVHSDGAQPLVAVAGFRAILREFCRTGDAAAAQLACGALDVPFDDDVSLAVLGPLVRPPAPGFSRTDRPGPSPPPA